MIISFPIAGYHLKPCVSSILGQLPFLKFRWTIRAKKPVKEFESVFTADFRGVGNHNLEPTFDDNKIKFDNALILGINQFAYTKDFINGKTFFYYRAYAILEDGSVIYGNRISFTV